MTILAPLKEAPNTDGIDPDYMVEAKEKMHIAASSNEAEKNVTGCLEKYLHSNRVVNEELWTEAKTYGDIQLMPFVDYSSLISWKTIAICIFGTEVISAKYLMKTDDDAFVRVDEVLASINRVNVIHGLFYGLINPDSQPHQNPDSKSKLGRRLKSL
ncbi:beta-1,3-galactosyltransferase GALT1 [Tanacetum coccineum]